MVSALAVGRDPTDAFRYGMAAGAAAVLNPGTGLCNPIDVERLFLSFREHDSNGILP
jgi:6-phosphofructokinase 2